MKKAVEYTVDNLKSLRTVMVYTLSNDDAKIHSYFRYAVDHGINIIIPGNRSRESNR